MKVPQGYIHNWKWDVLVILDACRYDFFEAANPFKGKLVKLEVKPTCTIDFLKENFPEAYPYVYVSGNPVCNSKVPLRGFRGGAHFKVVDVWKWGWSEELETVSPKAVTDEALKHLDASRLVVHYIQPHPPYIGKVRLRFWSWRPVPSGAAVWKTRKPKPPRKALLRAYGENLRLVLDEVEKLVDLAPGKKIVITSDHGELLLEDGKYGHPCGFKHPVLNTVPWLEVEK